MEGCGCLFLIIVLWGLYSVATDFFSFLRREGVWLFGVFIAMIVARKLYQKLTDTADGRSCGDFLKHDGDVGRDELNPQRDDEINELSSSPIFLIAAVLAKFAKFDGTVTQNEILTIEAILSDFGVAGPDRLDAIRIFTKHKNGVLSYGEVLLLLRNTPDFDEEFFFNLCIRLFHLAHADGVPSQYSIQNVQQACAVFGVDYVQIESCFRGADQSKSNDADYEILGVRRSDSDQIIKRRYRELTKTFHPDTLGGQGVSPAITELAAAKFREIQAAYERIMSKRNRP